MKQAVAWLGGIVAWAALSAGAADGVPYARDLRQDMAQARGVQGPLLIAFVGEHCGYCERVLNEFLIPMSRNTDYKRKVVMRRVEIGSERPLRDFAGRKIDHDTLANQYGVHFVPTVALFDEQGRMLGKPLVGLTTVDYYGMYLDETIDKAVAQVRAGK